jgi:hypothetical protein
VQRHISWMTRCAARGAFIKGSDRSVFNCIELLRSAEVGRHKLEGPSAARAQGWAKVEPCRSNCRGTLPSSVQGCIHKVNCAAREGALGYKVNCAAREGALGYKVNCAAREGPPEEPLGMSHSSPSALGYSVSRKLMSTNFCTP